MQQKKKSHKIIAIFYEILINTIQFIFNKIELYIQKQQYQNFYVLASMFVFLNMILVIFLPHILGFISSLIFTLILFYMIIRALANLLSQWKNIRELKHYNIFDDTIDLSAKSIIIKQFLSILYGCLFILTGIYIWINELTLINPSFIKVYNCIFIILISLMIASTVYILSYKYSSIRATLLFVAVLPIISVFLSSTILQEFIKLFEPVTSIEVNINFLRSNFFIGTSTIVISVLVQIIIVFVRPPYKLKSTHLAFIIVNVFCTISTLIIFIFINDFAVYIHEKMVSANISNIPTDAINDWLTKTIKIILLPYALGTGIGITFIVIRQHIFNKRAEKLFLNIMDTLVQKNELLLSDMDRQELFSKIKKCCYFGGFQFKMHFLGNTILRNFIDEMHITSEKK
ncbi:MULTISPECIES: hypothetical protein [Bacillus]|uniref:hypothetical protein n=1 Tax=Bacillus TaxID=1386 RepID=UPI0009D7A579|nr:MULTISPECIES: hypothetical protein [Bacillus]PEB95357.1 hypothetical protein CON04_30680 [Bacillus cereus]PEC27535.1 hypothetical protein CON75_13440 [Bacillus thuringiensis]PEQ71477.1 hypothetical protein CN478_28070 [Bacillus cereus]PFZ17443.1 hypothetical protein COL73_22795 [Bacillus thuringiensis]SMD40402.1 hypothetical protein SAMN06272738_5004 [Bacillus sp. JKS001846]